MPSIDDTGFRLGIIGFGRMGRLHAASVRAVLGASLVAFCDIDPAARDRATAEHGVPAFESMDNFLSFPMDGVIIASSTRTHAEHVHRSAEAGLAIFTEKPVGLTMPEADAALAAVTAAQVPFQIGYQRRWDPQYVEMKSRIQAGDIGVPMLFKAHGRDPDPSASTNWGLDNNGGLFSNCAIHDYDAARFLFGCEVQELTASGAVLVHHGLQEFDDLDACSTTLFLDSGKMALTEWTRFASHGYDIRAEVIGTEGIIQLDDAHPGGVIIRRRLESPPTVLDRFHMAYRASVSAFLKAIEEWTDPALSVQDARMALQIALTARSSYEKGSSLLPVPPLPELAIQP